MVSESVMRRGEIITWMQFQCVHSSYITVYNLSSQVENSIFPVYTSTLQIEFLNIFTRPQFFFIFSELKVSAFVCGQKTKTCRKKLHFVKYNRMCEQHTAGDGLITNGASKNHTAGILDGYPLPLFRSIPSTTA